MSKKESPQININADPALRQQNRSVIKSVSDNEMRGARSSSATLNSQTVNARDTARLVRTVQGTCNSSTSSNPSPAAYNNTDKVLKLDDKTFVVETSKDVYVNNYQEIVEQRYFNNSEGNVSAGYADGSNNYINVVSSANRLAFSEDDFQVTEISTGIAKISSIGGGGANGATGVSGFSGRSGYSGVTGATGISGFSGITGATGFSGYSGTVGATGVGSSITVKDEGSTLTTAATSLDFTGAGVTATTVGGAVTVTISGGGGSPAGSNTQIQYNDTGSFGATENLTFDELLPKFEVNGIVSGGPIHEEFRNTLPVGGIFDVTITATSPAAYSLANTTIIINNPGSGYSVGDIVTITGDQLGGSAPANNLSFTVTQVSPSKAIFNVNVQTTDVSYTGSNTAITIVDGGSNFTVGDIVTITGDQLGGFTPSNDLTFTVSAVAGPNNSISAISSISGTSAGSVNLYSNVVNETDGGVISFSSISGDCAGVSGTYNSLQSFTSVSATNTSIFYVQNYISWPYFSFAVKNLNLNVGKTTNLVLVIPQGSFTPSIPNKIFIDDIEYDINWIDGITPAGRSNSINIINFTLFRLSNTYTVLGQIIAFY